MPWKKQISSGKWHLNNNNNADESLHNLISHKNNNKNVSSSSNDSSNNDIDDVVNDVLSNNMQMMSSSSPGMVTNIIHGVKPSIVSDNDRSRLDTEVLTEESKGHVATNTPNNKEMRLIHRVSLSSNSDNSSSSSISSSSNESTTAIIHETMDDIICQIENKDLISRFMFTYQMQVNREKQELGPSEEDSHNSGELTKSCGSGDSIRMINSPSGKFHVPESALNKFLSSPSPTNWESLVSSMKHRCQSPWGDGEFAVINIEGNEEGSVVVSDFDDSIEENKYAFVSKYLKQQEDDTEVDIESFGREAEPSSTVALEEELPHETAADPENDDTQVGVEAAINNDTAEMESASNNIGDDAQVGVEDEAATNNEDSSAAVGESPPPIESLFYKKLSKRDTIYQSISMYKMKMKSFTRQCRAGRKESYSAIPTLEIKATGFSSDASIQRLQVPSSVTIIDKNAYNNCPNLSHVILSNGIEEIKDGSFHQCQNLERINIPSTVQTIGDEAFYHTKLSSIDLPDSIDSIGEECFRECRHLTNVRIPPLVRSLSRKVFQYNSFMFSVEIPKNVTRVDISCFSDCSMLRNIAFPPNAILSGVPTYGGYTKHTHDTFLWYILNHCRDLKEAYDSMPKQFKLQPIKKAFMNRFDGLPIHEILYYQSYYSLETVLERLDEAINQKRRSRVLSATYQGLLGIDWLGMTPLHILACSKRQSIELYHVVVERYPQNLITKDRFGAEPILYAIWGSAPSEIVQFLAESYRSKHPDYELDWYGMIMTLSTARSTRVLHTLFDTKETFFPDQKIRRWTSLIDEIAISIRVSIEVFRFIFGRVVSSRLDRIGLKRRILIYDQINAIPDINHHSLDMRRECLSRIRANLAIYEHDYQVLKEVVPVMELAVWKIKVDNEGASTSLSRRVCRYNCGADVVIGHVLPFLMRGVDNNE